MRLEQVYAALPAYFDRNPQAEHLYYSDTGVSPHSLTVRATYTVPANKKAIVSEIYLAVMRYDVATTYLVPAIFVRYTPSGGTARFIASASRHDNKRWEWTKIHLTNVLIMEEGDKLELLTEDGSTGGTCQYHGNVCIYQFG